MNANDIAENPHKNKKKSQVLFEKPQEPKTSICRPAPQDLVTDDINCWTTKNTTTTSKDCADFEVFEKQQQQRDGVVTTTSKQQQATNLTNTNNAVVANNKPRASHNSRGGQQQNVNKRKSRDADLLGLGSTGLETAGESLGSKCSPLRRSQQQPVVVVEKPVVLEDIEKHTITVYHKGEKNIVSWYADMAKSDVQQIFVLVVGDDQNRHYIISVCFFEHPRNKSVKNTKCFDSKKKNLNNLICGKIRLSLALVFLFPKIKSS